MSLMIDSPMVALDEYSFNNITLTRSLPQPDPKAFVWAVLSEVRSNREALIEQLAKADGLSPDNAAVQLDDTSAYLLTFADRLAQSRYNNVIDKMKTIDVIGRSQSIERALGRILMVATNTSHQLQTWCALIAILTAGNSVHLAMFTKPRPSMLCLVGILQRALPHRLTVSTCIKHDGIAKLLTKTTLDAVVLCNKSTSTLNVAAKAAKMAGIPFICAPPRRTIVVVGTSWPHKNIASLGQIAAKKDFCDSLTHSQVIYCVPSSLMKIFARSFIKERGKQINEEDLYDEQYFHLTSNFADQSFEKPVFFTYDDNQGLINGLVSAPHYSCLMIFSGKIDEIRSIIKYTRVKYCQVANMANITEGNKDILEKKLDRADNLVELFNLTRTLTHISLHNHKKNTRASRAHLSGTVQFQTKPCFLWGHPRSRSTALERAFIERGDCAVLHEPLSKYAYFGGDIDRIIVALSDMSEFVEGRYLADVRFCPNEPRYGVVKDFPYHALSFIPDWLLRQYHHIFLVRTPEATIQSLNKVQPSFNDGEVGYIELLALATRLRYGLNLPVKLVLADEFARSPESILRGCCEFMDMPYKPTMLEWPARDQIPAWRYWSGFHDTALMSQTVSPKYQDTNSAPLSQRHQILINSMEDIYRKILKIFC